MMHLLFTTGILGTVLALIPWLCTTFYRKPHRFVIAFCYLAASFILLIFGVLLRLFFDDCDCWNQIDTLFR